MATRSLMEIDRAKARNTSRMAEVQEEIDRLAARDDLTAGQVEHLERKRTEFNKLSNEHLELMDETRAALIEGRNDGSLQVDSGFDQLNNWTGAPIEEKPTSERGKALTLIERWKAPDKLKSNATTLIERTDDHGVIDHVATFSSPAYLSAFQAMMRDPEGFGDTLNAEERAALRYARTYTRATLALAGTVLPSPLDPSIVLSNVGVENPMRAVSRVVTTSANTWRGISSAGVTASFDAEAAEVSDDTPSLTGTTVTLRKAQSMAIATVEAFEDQSGGFADQLAMMFGDAKDRLEGAKFVKGVAGSNEPIGIETAIDGSAYELAPATGEAFAAVDVYTTLEGLAPRWRQNASWQLELSTFNQIWRFYSPAGTEPPIIVDGKILGLPYNLNSSIDAYSDINPAATEDNFILFVGDFGRGYVIVDRVGMSVSKPQLLQNSGNMRFDGTVGVYAYWRVGADIQVDGSIVALSIPTAA